MENKDFFRNKYHPLFKEIEESCLKIQKINQKNRFNPFAFVNKMIAENVHPGALSDCLDQYRTRCDYIRNPYAYLRSILKKSNGNYWEKDHIENHNQIKQEFESYMAESDIMNKLPEIGRRIE